MKLKLALVPPWFCTRSANIYMHITLRLSYPIKVIITKVNQTNWDKSGFIHILLDNDMRIIKIQVCKKNQACQWKKIV